MTITSLLIPPVAFVIYLVLVSLLAGFGRVLAGPGDATPMKTSTYAGGEMPPAAGAAPGYNPFFVLALFFAVLHLGVLVLASGNIGLTAGLYLGGLALVLIVLILG